MSTNKYQNAPNRTTIQEAHYGVPLTGIALKHVRRIERYEHAKGVLRATWKVLREARKPLSRLIIRRQIKRLRRREDILAKSKLRVEKDQAALASVIEVMKRMREKVIAYPSYFDSLRWYFEAGQRFRPKLLMLSGKEKTHFSREIKKYGLVLEDDKRGLASNLTLDQEIRKLEVELLDGYGVAPANLKRKIRRLQEQKLEQAERAWIEAQIKRPLTDLEWRMYQVEQAEKLAEGVRILAKQERKKSS